MLPWSTSYAAEVVYSVVTEYFCVNTGILTPTGNEIVVSVSISIAQAFIESGQADEFMNQLLSGVGM